MDQSSQSILQDDLCFVRDHKRILELAPVLKDLARNTGQLGAMHWLDYFLTTRSLASKPPCLVLQLNRRVKLEELLASDIRSAALFFEYKIAGLRTGVFSTDDAVGYRTVIAQAHERERFADRAACALIDSGAHIVLANYQPADEKIVSSASRRKMLFARRERRVRRMLPLLPTFDETLSQFGHSTRFNLRYYRRRLAKRMQLEYLADVRQHLTLAEFKLLNNTSLNPVHSSHEIDLRWNCSCDSPDSFVVGLRSSKGEWLSLIGGWRQDTTTVLHWQLNSAGCEKDSIGTVMRSFFLEHEIASGARELLIYGGTPHTIQHAFREDTIVDLLLCRDSLRSRIFRTFARRLNREGTFLSSNHLLRTLGEVDLQSIHPEFSSPAYPRLSSFEEKLFAE